MNQLNNIKQEPASKSNEKELRDKLIKRNYKTGEANTSEENAKEGDLNPTNKISKNIHTEPAEEQQFENED